LPSERYLVEAAHGVVNPQKKLDDREKTTRFLPGFQSGMMRVPKHHQTGFDVR
jgi:hypothetical protein